MPDTALNAYCLPLTNKESAIIINSSLVELLDQKEMEYIIGHEIGHHLFSHLNYPAINVENNDNIALKNYPKQQKLALIV